MTYKEVREKCFKHNETNGIKYQFGDKNPLRFKAIFKENALPHTSVEERTYEFTSDNKAFVSNMCGYSIFANCKVNGNYTRIENVLHLVEDFQEVK